MSRQNAQSEAIVRQPLLTAILDPAKSTNRVEVKKIEFKPGQATGLHLHPGPVTGYIAKGTVLFQVEGQPPSTLEAGDAFFEPPGIRILHFDNASTTEPMVFIAFYLLGEGEHELIRMLG
jgi:quercetin dioxygenase-like cupin family protein